MHTCSTSAGASVPGKVCRSISTDSWIWLRSRGNLAGVAEKLFEYPADAYLIHRDSRQTVAQGQVDSQLLAPQNISMFTERIVEQRNKVRSAIPWHKPAFRDQAGMLPIHR